MASFALTLSDTNAQQYWDGSDVTSGNGPPVGGPGIWDAATENWTNDAVGTTNQTWASGNAVFGTVGGGVAVSGNQTVGDITFSTDGYDISGGTLTIAGSTVDVATGTATISSTIAGSDLTKSGTGTLVLSGTSAITGDFRIVEGSVTLASAGALSGTLTGFNIQDDVATTGSQVSVNLGGNTVTTGTFIINGVGATGVSNGTLSFSGLGQFGVGEISAVLTGTGNLRKFGSLTGTLTAVNTYTGITEIAKNTLTISSTGSILNTASIDIQANATTAILNVDGVGGNALGDTVAITNAGQFVLTGSNETIGSISGAGSINLNGNTLTTGDAGNDTVSGKISGSGGLTKQGAGILTLSGSNTYEGATTINGGTLRASNASALGVNSAVTVSAGTVLDLTTALNIGSLAGAGSVTNGGNLLTLGNGTANFSGSISGAGGLTKSGTGVQTLSGSNTYGGTTTVTAGTLNVTSSIASTTLNITGGELQVAGGVLDSGATVTLTGSGLLDVNGVESITTLNVNANGANVTVDGGTFTISGTTTNIGTITIGDNTTFASGVITNNVGGQISVGAAATLRGTANTLNNNALITVAAGGIVTDVGAINNNTTGTITFADGGSLIADNDFSGNESISNAGALNVNGGTVIASTGGTGILNNTGTTTVAAGATLSVLGIGASGFTNASGGLLTLTGALTGNLNALAGSITNVTAATGSISGTTNNAGTLTNTGGTLTGLLTNTGTATLTGGSVGGLVNTSGTVTSTGAVTNTGVLTNNSTLTMGDGTAGDSMTVAGATSGTGTINLDIDLSNSAGGIGPSDYLVLNGANSGTQVINFTISNGAGTNGLQSVPTVILDGGNSGTLTATSVNVTNGLPADDTLIYRFETLGDDFVVRSQINPAVSGITGGIALTQSLVSNGVDHRSAATFDVSLNSGQDDSCGEAFWLKATGGYAGLTGTTSGGTALPTNATNQNLQHSGLHIGGDFGCFNNSASGWNVAAGGMFGMNMGTTAQTVDVYSATSAANFDQYYGGLYLAAVNGPWDLDLQLRGENTGLDYVFDFDTTVPGTESVSIGTSATTFSGSVSYTMPLYENGLTFVPTAGFSVTKSTASLLTFASGDTLQIEEHDAPYGFIGGTLAKTKIGINGTSATNHFVSAKVYGDFGDDWNSTFATGATIVPLTTSGLGTFGELSVGINYAKALRVGRFGNARQLNAGLGAFVRGSSNQTSAGLTAQARIQW